MVLYPNKNDVLLGRGPIYSEHPGNHQFRELVQEQKEKYLKMRKKKDKRNIALGIIDQIARMDPPGRFLKECKGGDVRDEYWVCVDSDVAIEKVLHRLREKKKLKGEDAAGGTGGVLSANVSFFDTPRGSPTSGGGDSSNGTFTPPAGYSGYVGVDLSYTSETVSTDESIVTTQSNIPSSSVDCISSSKTSKDPVGMTSNKPAGHSSNDDNLLSTLQNKIHSNLRVNQPPPQTGLSNQHQSQHPIQITRQQKYTLQTHHEGKEEKSVENDDLFVNPLPFTVADDRGGSEWISNQTVLEFLTSNLGEDYFSADGSTSEGEVEGTQQVLKDQLPADPWDEFMSSKRLSAIKFDVGNTIVSQEISLQTVDADNQITQQNLRQLGPKDMEPLSIPAGADFFASEGMLRENRNQANTFNKDPAAPAQLSRGVFETPSMNGKTEENHVHRGNKNTREVMMTMKAWVVMAAQWLSSCSNASSSSSPSSDYELYMGKNSEYQKVYIPMAVDVARKLVDFLLSTRNINSNKDEEHFDNGSPSVAVKISPFDLNSISLNIRCYDSAVGSKDFFDGGHVVGSVDVSAADGRPIVDGNGADDESRVVFRCLCDTFQNLFTLGKITETTDEANHDDWGSRDNEDTINAQFYSTLNIQDEQSFNEPSTSDRKFRKRDNPHALPELQGFGVPLSLCRLISDMKRHCRRCGSDGDLIKLEDVSSELGQMMVEPDRFLYDVEPSLVDNPDHLRSRPCVVPKFRLKGREKELATLIQAAEGVFREFGSTVVWISGESGVGKTTLVQQLEDHIAKNQFGLTSKPNDRGEFTCSFGVPILSCKFDLMKHVKPFGKIASAFDNYFSHLLSQLERGTGIGHGNHSTDQHQGIDGFFAALIQTLDSTLGRSVSALCGVIPTFGIIYKRFSEPCSSTYNQAVLSRTGTAEGASAKTRIHFIFCKLLHAMSVHSAGPIVLVLDDCQWADGPSLDLLRDLTYEFSRGIGSGDSSGILIIGCYRKDEVGMSRPLIICKSELALNPATRMVDICLGNFNKEEIQVLVSDALALPVRVVQPLTSIVFVKTLGSPLLLVQYIESLVTEGLLYFSLNEKRWLWNLSKISAKPMDDNIAKHFARKIHSLPLKIRTALKIVSCFGCTIGTDALHLLSNQGVGDIDMALEEAVTQGFMIEVERSFKFSHDAIQQAAYSLIPPEKRSQYHKVLGQRLIARSSSTGEMDNADVFLIVDQINRLNRQSLSPVECHQYAKLNAQAAQYSLQLFNFGSSLEYVKAGIELLGGDHWTCQYDLALQLYEAGAAACYSEGRHSEMKVYLDAVLCNGKCIFDKMESFIVLILSLNSAGDLKEKESLKCLVDVLRQLDEHFPEEIDEVVIRTTMMKTMASLKGLDEKYFNTLHPMTDKSKLSVMRLLRVGLKVAFRMSSKMGVLFVCRMVELTLSLGLAKESARSIVGLAYQLTLVTQNIEGGYKIGKLAMSMLDNPIFENEYGSVSMIFYGVISSNITPIQAISDPMLKAYDNLILTGNPDQAASVCQAYCQFRFIAGVALPSVLNDYMHFISEMLRYKQINYIRLLLASYHSVLAFMEVEENPLLSVLGEEFNKENLFKYAVENKDSASLSYIFLNNLRESDWFGDFNQVVYLMEKIENAGAKDVVNQSPHQSFIEGSCLFRLARFTGNSKWYNRGLVHIKILERWTELSQWNWENKLFCLKAEKLFSDGSYTEAAHCYQLSVDAARRSRFVHLEGRAFELWAFMCKEIGDTAGYLTNLKEAQRCYQSWGSPKKCDHIAKQLIDAKSA